MEDDIDCREIVRRRPFIRAIPIMSAEGGATGISGCAGASAIITDANRVEAPQSGSPARHSFRHRVGGVRDIS